jgi:hypothetical protein
MPTNSAGRNHKRTKESSLFGTRKLAFYTVTADPEYGMIGNVQQGYSFRVSTITGLVTLDADITAKHINDMTDEETGEIDDEYVTLTLPFDIEVFGGGLTDTIYVSSNSGISFYNGNSSTPDPDSSGNIGEPAIQIASNDGDLQFLYTDDSIVGQYRVKFRGNTDYNNDTVVNLVWEALFREGEDYIDFLVTAQPADWAAYDDGEGNVSWGVTDGTTWVDGRTVEERGTSFAPFVALSDEFWAQPNSIYYQVVQAIQNAGAEIYWLGTPHNASEPFTIDWSALTYADNADSFTFAIADDASNPVAILDEVWTYTAVSTGTVLEQNWIGFDTMPTSGGPNGNGIFIGQPVVFSGTTFGGIVAGQTYYVADYATYDTNSKFAITVSETVNPEVLDITYPEGVGGDPGLEFVPTVDTGSMTATFYNYDIEWGGTAGDTASSCCYNLTAPGIVPERLLYAITQSGAFNNESLPGGFWWIERSNPSYGIFPAWWTAGINLT